MQVLLCKLLQFLWRFVWKVNFFEVVSGVSFPCASLVYSCGLWERWWREWVFLYQPYECLQRVRRVCAQSQNDIVSVVANLQPRIRSKFAFPPQLRVPPVCVEIIPANDSPSQNGSSGSVANVKNKHSSHLQIHFTASKYIRKKNKQMRVIFFTYKYVTESIRMHCNIRNLVL